MGCLCIDFYFAMAVSANHLLSAAKAATLPLGAIAVVVRSNLRIPQIYGLHCGGSIFMFLHVLSMTAKIQHQVKIAIGARVHVHIYRQLPGPPKSLTWHAICFVGHRTTAYHHRASERAPHAGCYRECASPL